MKRSALCWSGLVLVTTSALASAAVNAEPLPGWDADPTRVNIAIIGLGPTASMLLDLLAWLGAMIVFLSKPKSARLDPLALLGFVGAIAILLRTLLIDGQNPEALRIGSSWAAAWVSFACVLSQAHRPLVRSVLGSIVIAFVLYLGLKALVQAFVEHPAMLAQFDANKAESLAAQGYEPGSAQALMYERRLRQPDPTGWFGLSNVLAGVLASGSIALGYIGFRLRGAARAGVLVAAGLVLFCLLLTGSKAGLGVFLIGAFVLLAARFFPRRLVPLAVIGAVLIPPMAVIARGVTGIPEGELSLLVRWFYMQGAVDITSQSLPFGVGPAGFQDAYALAKPIGATEDVTSPHMVWLDYAATLGVFALPVIAALAWVIVRLWQNLAHDASAHTLTKNQLRHVRPVVIGALLLPVLLGAYLEMQATPIENALARFVGVLIWAGAAFVLIRSGHPSRRALAGAALVLLLHSELDMLMTLPGSTPLVLVTLAFAAAHRTSTKAMPAWPLGLLSLIAAALLCFAALGVWSWESKLRTSSARLGELVDQREALTERGPTPADWAKLQSQFAEAGAISLDELQEALGVMHADERLAHAAARLAVTLADTAQALGRDGEREAFVREAIALLTSAIEQQPTASLHAHRARLYLLPDVQTGGPDLAEAIADLEEASRLAPQTPTHPAALALTLRDAGRMGEARKWAEEALRRDDLTALDPLAALSEDLRRRLERITRTP